jgi:hypothetical protein
MVSKLPLIAGAVALAAASAPARAMPDPADSLRAQSFAELLAPIPDAQTKLAALDAAPIEENDPVQNVQYYYHHHHHHHHHHHNHWRRRFIPPPWYHHHHHHHHHHHYYDE